MGTSISVDMQEKIKYILKIPFIGLYYISINGKSLKYIFIYKNS